jgi:tRNA A37 threonylcarbamoyladenosine dehydratase
MDDMSRSVVYDRQESLLLTTPKSVAVVGLGGIGTWVAIFAAMSGIPRLVLFDDDTLDVTNLNRLPYTPADVGKPKTELASQFIAKLRPECMVELAGRATDVNIPMSGVQFVIDCTDSLTTQLMLCKTCSYTDGKIVYERAGYDGTSFTVADSIPGWTTEETPTVGYRHDPSWV